MGIPTLTTTTRLSQHQCTNHRVRERDHLYHRRAGSSHGRSGLTEECSESDGVVTVQAKAQTVVTTPPPRYLQTAVAWLL